MTGESKSTTEHETIKKWTEARGGVPARVKGTSRNGDGLLRIHFPVSKKEDSLEEISWEEFFETFENNQLSFLYQEELAEGKESRFFKLIKRNGSN